MGVRITTDYTDGEYSMHRVPKGAPFSQVIPTNVWRLYQDYVRTSRHWHHIIRAYDNELFLAQEKARGSKQDHSPAGSVVSGSVVPKRKVGSAAPTKRRAGPQRR